VDGAAEFHLRALAGGDMSHFAIKGCCPGALRPMRSGDGLVVRIRPHGGRLSQAQAVGLVELADRFGNGLMDITNRANLQIRGVSDAGHEHLIVELTRLDLIDANSEVESLRNIVVAPFWVEGDDTAPLVAEFELAIAARRLDLPAKFGFAFDGGPERTLADTSADIRIERDRTGGLIVRADGAGRGRPVARSEAVGVVLALAEWFVVSGGVKDGRGRMAAHLAAGALIPDLLAGLAIPVPMTLKPGPGLRAGGALVGFAFGQLKAETLRVLAGNRRACA
jgi:precorrin-3B synthase